MTASALLTGMATSQSQLKQQCQRLIIASNTMQAVSSTEELGQTGNIKLHSALPRFLGNRLLYGQMARRFCLEKAGLFADIQTALASDDLSTAYELAHGL